METITGMKRTAYALDTASRNEGDIVTLCGWVQKQRDLGNLIFVDLRDRTGIVQLAFDDTTDRTVFETASSLRAEYVIAAKGVIRKREAPNKEIPTGLIEVFVQELRLLTKAETPPFEILDNTNVKEELRLKHRYLDLRRPTLQKTLATRHRIAQETRKYFDENGFIEIETPMLTKSTPEGARDYLVPSRVHPGCFYALPQSPQLYKQLLMMSGFDRYMQIVKCFRDEDLRADRQPEFTQVDLEMSFVDEEDVMAINEGYMRRLFRTVLGKELPEKILRLPYAEAMDRYGSDKPDIRFGLELCDLTDIVKDSAFSVFSGAVAAGGSVRGINVKGAASRLSRKEIDKLTEFVKTYRAKGLAFTRLTAEAESSSFEKFLSPEEKAAVRERLGAETGDVLLIVADGKNDTVYAALGALRKEVANRLELYDPSEYAVLWVTDFPLFEYSEEEGRFMAKHHPFTCPNLEDLPLLATDPGAVRSRAYDFVINGYEAGGGSIRISDPELQQQMLEALGFSAESAKERFGFLLDALRYGVPPHGGLAWGLDRITMILTGTDNIRDVIAFPKVQNASELMTACPSEVDQKQLDELALAIAKHEE